MAEYDFEYDLEKEKLALEKDYLKASHRYEKKLEGKEGQGIEDKRAALNKKIDALNDLLNK